MADDPRGGYLGEEFFFPDCPGCGSEGELNVIRYHGGDVYEWKCLGCDQGFHTPETSSWYRLDQIPPHLKDVYVAVEIRGVSHSYYAQSGKVKRRQVKTYIRRARRALEEAREGEIEPKKTWASLVSRDSRGRFTPIEGASGD